MQGWRRETQGRGHRWAATASGVLLMLLYTAPAVALEKPIRIGVLTPAWGPPGGLDGLIEGLVDLGYRENEDFVIGLRFTQGDLSALPAVAEAMVEGGVDLIFAAGEHAARAAHIHAPDHFPAGRRPDRARPHSVL